MPRAVLFGALLGVIIGFALEIADIYRDNAQLETLKDIRAQVTALEVMTCK